MTNPAYHILSLKNCHLAAIFSTTERVHKIKHIFVCASVWQSLSQMSLFQPLGTSWLFNPPEDSRVSPKRFQAVLVPLLTGSVDIGEVHLPAATGVHGQNTLGTVIPLANTPGASRCLKKGWITTEFCGSWVFQCSTLNWRCILMGTEI